jgi:hypothetical protein
LLGRPEATHWLTASWRDRLLTPAMGYPTPLPTLLQFVTMHRGGPSRTHVLSLLVHLANVLLAWALVARWSRRRALAWPRCGPPILCSWRVWCGSRT